MNKRFLTLAAFVILLVSFAVGLSVSGAPNFGIDKQQSFGTYVWVGNDITIASSYKWGEAPWSMSFYVNVRGSSPGQLTDVLVICNDDAGHVLTSTSTLEPQRLADDRTQYTIDGYCTYESATTADNYPEIRVVYQGVTYTRTVNIIVWESVGSIDVRLEVEPLTSTEITDLTMTATVIGETGNNTECKFWCDCNSPDAQYDELGVCNAPDAGAGVSTSDPGVTGVCMDTTSCVNLTDGEYTAAVACQRNGQEDTTYVPYTILADTIYGLSLTADPGHGDTGGGTLDNVDLEATFSTSCLASGTFDIEFDCENDAAADETYAAEDLADYVDEEGLITFSMRGDGGSVKCDGYPVGTTKAEVTVDCENATTATAVTDVVGENAPATTFFFSSSTVPPGGVESLNDVRVWVGAWDGTAIGDITIDAVDCDTGAADNEGVDYFSAGYNIGDLSSSYNLFQQGISCDYATDAVYEGDVDATRDGVSFTTTFYVTVTPQPNPPIFQLSETSFNRMALAGEDADDVVFTVGNDGGGTLTWTDEIFASWLTCLPVTETALHGESDEVTCEIASSTLGEGSYSSTIIYSDPNATPTSPLIPVTVNLQVTPVSTPIHLEVDTNLTAGPSPLAVDFSTVEASFGSDYTSSTRHETSAIDADIFARLYYEWDFGDDDFLGLDCQGADSGNLGCRWDAITVANGADANHRQSRNYMTGPLGAHVYEPATFPDTCGGVACRVYYPSLRVTDEDDNVASWSGTVSVYDPDSEGANGWGDANETACVYENGGAVGTGCPFTCDYTHPVAATNAYCLSHATNDFDALLTDLITTKGYRRILFKGGETWDMDTLYTIAVAGPGLIGSYGGSIFTIDIAAVTPASNYAIEIEEDNWRFQDFELDGTHRGNYTAVISYSTANVNNFLMQRTVVDDSSEFETVINFPMSRIAKGADSETNKHIFIIDNNWDDLTDLSNHGGAFVYVTAANLNILGNYLGSVGYNPVGPVWGGEHVIRTVGGVRILISNNLLGPQEAGRGVINGRDNPLGDLGWCTSCVANSTCAPGCGVPVRHFLVQDNNMIVASGGAGFSCCMSGDGWSGDETFPSYDIIAERNYLTIDQRGLAGPGWIYSLQFSNGVEYRTTIRNNIINMTGNAATHGQFFLVRGTKGNSGLRGTDFYNNTCYTSETGTHDSFACLYNGVDSCYNNVMYAPNHTNHSWRAIPPFVGAATACTNESNNFDDGTSANINSPPFYSSPPTARWGFWPVTGDLQGGGIAVPGLFDDALMTCGPRGDAGAMEWTESSDPARPVDGVPGCR